MAPTDMPTTPEALGDRRFGHPATVKESEYWKQRIYAEQAVEPPSSGVPLAPANFHAATEMQARKDAGTFTTSKAIQPPPATPNLRASWRTDQPPVESRTFLGGLLEGEQIPQIRHVAYVSPYSEANDAGTSHGTGRLANSIAAAVDVKSKEMANNNPNEKVHNYRMHKDNPTHGAKAWDKIHTKGAVDIKGATLQFQTPLKEMEHGKNMPQEGKRIKDMKHWSGTEFSSFFTLDNQLDTNIKKL